MKKNLKLAGNLCLIVFAFDIVSLLLDIFYYPFSVFYVVFDSLSIALSLSTGIIYLSLMNKNAEELFKLKPLFLTLLIVNIFNGFIVWLISSFVYMSVTNKQQKSFFPFATFGEEQKSKETTQTEDINLDDDSYKERKIAKDLTERLEELNKLKDKNLISEEEYKSMREEEIKKHFS